MQLLLVYVLVDVIVVGYGQTAYARNEVPTHWPGQPNHIVGSPLFKKGTSFVDKAREFVVNHFEEFAQVYRERPIKQNQCGIRVNHALALYTMIKSLQPNTVIESGVNAGQSTYFIRKAAPSAKIISMDPKEEGVCKEGARWIDNTNNVYLTGEKFVDITEVDWSAYDNITHNSKTVVFLDDHMPVLTRIPALLKHGFSHLIVEDNYMPGEAEKNVGLKSLFFSNSTQAQEVASQLELYSEFPPLVYGKKFADFSRASSVKVRMTAKLHHTSDFHMITEPLLWLDDPETGEDNLKWYHRFMKELNYQVETLKDWKTFNEMMIYNQILYVKLKTV